MHYSVDQIEELCDRFGVQPEDVFDRVMYVNINGSEEDLIDTLMSGGEQCEDCGSWAPCALSDPDVQMSMDDKPFKQVGYVWTTRLRLKCEGCGKTYAIRTDLSQRERV